MPRVTQIKILTPNRQYVTLLVNVPYMNIDHPQGAFVVRNDAGIFRVTVNREVDQGGLHIVFSVAAGKHMSQIWARGGDARGRDSMRN